MNAMGPLINISMSVISFLIGFLALKKYLSYSKNYEHILYWGMSFIAISVTFAIILIEPLVIYRSRQNMAYVMHVTLEIAYILQLYAVTYSTYSCYKYDTDLCIHHKVCRKKAMRISFWTISAIVLTVGQLLYIPNGNAGSYGIVGLQIIGIFPLDMFCELVHIATLSAIAFILWNYRRFNIYLYFSYAMLAISDIIKIFNIMDFGYGNTNMQQIEWGLTVGAMVIMFLEIEKVILKE